jgi:hypothetical protein
MHRAYERIQGMQRLHKLGLILAGYGVSLLLTYAAFSVWPRYNGPDASGGMQAFGDFLLFAGLFGLFSLVATVAALLLLCPSEKFWTGFSTMSLAVAATGPLAAIMMGRPWVSPWAVLVWGFFGLMRLLGTPLLALGFLICTFLASIKRARIFLFVAALMEAAVAAYVFFSLVVLGHWL